MCVAENIRLKQEAFLEITDHSKVDLGHQPRYTPKFPLTLDHFIICAFHKCWGHAVQTSYSLTVWAS